MWNRLRQGLDRERAISVRVGVAPVQTALAATVKAKGREREDGKGKAQERAVSQVSSKELTVRGGGSPPSAWSGVTTQDWLELGSNPPALGYFDQ